MSRITHFCGNFLTFKMGSWKESNFSHVCVVVDAGLVPLPGHVPADAVPVAAQASVFQAWRLWASLHQPQRGNIRPCCNAQSC